MKISAIFLAFVLALGATQALAKPQTRFYGPDGKSIGTAVPLGNGSVRYYDARGNSLGISSTTGNTTRFYDAGGRPTGSFKFDGRMRRPAIPGTAR
jgi:YD repeat-containing protein